MLSVVGSNLGEQANDYLIAYFRVVVGGHDRVYKAILARRIATNRTHAASNSQHGTFLADSAAFQGYVLATFGDSVAMIRTRCCSNPNLRINRKLMRARFVDSPVTPC